MAWVAAMAQVQSLAPHKFSLYIYYPCIIHTHTHTHIHRFIYIKFSVSALDDFLGSSGTTENTKGYISSSRSVRNPDLSLKYLYY